MDRQEQEEAVYFFGMRERESEPDVVVEAIKYNILHFVHMAVVAGALSSAVERFIEGEYLQAAIFSAATVLGVDNGVRSMMLVKEAERKLQRPFNKPK